MFVTGASTCPPALGLAPVEHQAERSLTDLDRAITDLAADINAATCTWLGLVSEFDRRDGHEEFGFVSCSSWLAWRCSLTPRAAREQLRVARSLDSLPRIRREFAAGTLSYSKVRALSRVAEPEMEPELVELAREATAAQLERLLRGYRGAIAGDQHERAQERRHLSTNWDDGSLVIRGSLPAEEGAVLLKALEIAREELVRERRGEAAPTKARDSDRSGENGRITNADALVAVAESALVSGVSAVTGGDRHQVVVHVDVDALVTRTGPGDGAGEVARAVPIPAETVRRLACDASVVTLIERSGEPLSVGRKTRSIPPAIARALRARDWGCQFPGCEREQFVDAHHIEHWAHGGETSLDNLVRLCRHHHRLVHEGGFAVERSGSGARFRRPNGLEISPVPPAVEGSPARVVDARRRQRARAGAAERDCRPRSRGEPMDLDLGVLVLADLHERRTSSAAG